MQRNLRGIGRISSIEGWWSNQESSPPYEFTQFQNYVWIFDSVTFGVIESKSVAFCCITIWSPWLNHWSLIFLCCPTCQGTASFHHVLPTWANVLDGCLDSCRNLRHGKSSVHPPGHSVLDGKVRDHPPIAFNMSAKEFNKTSSPAVITRKHH